MSDYTPGPWTKTAKYTVRNGSMLVASCNWQNGEANARLIAVAPELLELAEQYASECVECTGDGVIEATGESCPECANIRAVIAKTTSHS